jgi:excisionase family DNA binding protein
MTEAIATPFWTTRQLAAYFGVSHVTVAAWIKQGKLPAPRQHPHGGARFWLKEDLRRPGS